MNFKLIRAFTFFFLLFFFNTDSYAKQGDEKILKDLSSTQFLSFTSVLKKNSVAILFQPNCSSCKKQIKNLDCLKEHSNNIVLIGSYGTEEQIKKSFLKKRTVFKGYYLPESQVSRLGFETGITPQTVYRSESKLIQFSGYQSCDKLVKKIKELNGNS